MDTKILVRSPGDHPWITAHPGIRYNFAPGKNAAPGLRRDCDRLLAGQLRISVRARTHPTENLSSSGICVLLGRFGRASGGFPPFAVGSDSPAFSAAALHDWRNTEGIDASAGALPGFHFRGTNQKHHNLFEL